MDFEKFDWTGHFAESITSQEQSKPKPEKMDVPFINKQIVCHDYHDHSSTTMRDALLSQLESNMSNTGKLTFGGVAVPFPTKLHIILSKAEDSSFGNIISW